MEAGSDPPAHPRRAGVLERAHGGTLLLDEVSDMPLETQGKIVRALAGPDVRAAGRIGPGEGGCAGAVHDQPRPAGGNRRRAGSVRICITAWPWCR